MCLPDSLWIIWRHDRHCIISLKISCRRSFRSHCTSIIRPIYYTHFYLLSRCTNCFISLFLLPLLRIRSGIYPIRYLHLIRFLPRRSDRKPSY
ncbi:hypothetical protein Plhal304r1_c050g0133261 [Plasmopara halstedii]